MKSISESTIYIKIYILTYKLYLEEKINKIMNFV
jgi:hypothetical protein